ncbi:MAG: hypothetical protein VX252_12255 [Myxococcota bacterium]|nr:hypothetical protein [Myxococcota bacterium]
MNRDSEEEALSALLDGELSEEREEELRRRMADDPALAARCAELAEVGGLLQKLAEPMPEADRLQRMHADLRSRIEADGVEPEQETQRGTDIPLAPRRGRPLVAPAAALAAALALYLAVGERGTESPSAPVSEAIGLAEGSVPEAESPVLLRPPVEPFVPEASQFAQVPAPEEAGAPANVYPEEVAPMLEPPQVEEPTVVAVVEPEPLVLPDSDERLAIALDYEMLADFDVISNLELLEFLGELENVESM